MALRDILDIGRCCNALVRQAGVGIHLVMRIHARVTLLVYLVLVHLRTPLARAVLGRPGRCNQIGIDSQAGFEHQAFGNRVSVDRDQQLNHQVVLLNQVAKEEDGGLVRQSGQACVRTKNKAAFSEMLCHFHGWVRQTELMLQEFDAQHSRKGKVRTNVICVHSYRRERPDQTSPASSTEQASSTLRETICATFGELAPA